jgi:hypothetical protein
LRLDQPPKFIFVDLLVGELLHPLLQVRARLLEERFRVLFTLRRELLEVLLSQRAELAFDVVEYLIEVSHIDPFA